ncbi:hypothetical protein B296_00002323 [Ensete ventricosum]|uniref:Uncharacterized protein n=1 Tax=Ensete ventricosum TaxID=4639 RepID=A0A427BAJ0_ENSVE|nr:hypothetical protein B296_00002323 [Ensete ventricosum]
MASSVLRSSHLPSRPLFAAHFRWWPTMGDDRTAAESMALRWEVASWLRIAVAGRGKDEKDRRRGIEGGDYEGERWRATRAKPRMRSGEEEEEGRGRGR